MRDFMWELREAVADGLKDGTGAGWFALAGLLVAILYLVAVLLSPLALAVRLFSHRTAL